MEQKRLAYMDGEHMYIANVSLYVLVKQFSAHN